MDKTEPARHIRYFLNGREINLADLTEEATTTMANNEDDVDAIKNEIATIERIEDDLRVEAVRLVDSHPELAAAKTRLADRMRESAGKLKVQL